MRELLIDSSTGVALPLFDGSSTAPMERLSSAIWVFDLASFRMVWGNAAALKLWDADSLEQFLARDARPQSVGVRQRLENVRHELELGREVVENWTLFPAGRPTPLKCRMTGLRLADGHVAMLVEATPIDAGAEYLSELRMIEAVRHAPMLISLFTAEGRGLMHNPAAHAWLHQVELDEDQAGDLFLAMFNDKRSAERLRRRAVRTGVASAWIAVVGKGNPVHAVNLRRIIDPISGGTSILVARGDMTRTVRLERRLERALVRERTISENQRHFLALTSHEFRTPLSVIDGAARKMLRLGADLNPTIAEKAQIIRGSVTRMLAAIDKTLTASRIQEGKVAFHPVDADLVAIVERAIATQRALTPDRVIQFHPAKLPRLSLDGFIVEQVLDNLISNAIKYSFPDTPIRIETAVGKKYVSVVVGNVGIGIPEQDIPRIFDRFFRASNVRGIKGTGIGLHTVQYFMKLHGGGVTIRSTEQQGTEVELRFPRP